MAESLRFQTRARTVDHLGREQIADCPTAISELWKNAYDAYARSASLQIFDGDSTVAAIFDNGHGMSKKEFIEKWLVIGTESKLGWSITPKEDRNELPYRRRQGKKGIGRLSAAYLGNLLLVVTKRKNEEFVAALIDWRLFQNPFLFLEDVRIPLTTFADKEELFGEIPKLYNALMGNVWGDPEDKDKARGDRIIKAWESYDQVETKSMDPQMTTRANLEKTLIDQAFNVRHLSEWEVWSGEADHGTAMLIAGVIPDIEVQLFPNSKSATDQQCRDLLRSTLWSFVDPFTELAKSHDSKGALVDDFSTSVIGWRGDQRMPIVEQAAGFEAHCAENLEHVIAGHVDEEGVFRGRVKAFGKWLEEVVIRFEEEVPKRADSLVGGFDFYVGAMEMNPMNTTLSDEEFSHFSRLLSQFSGLMVFRDGFRVMPYGRPDSDYFEVEQRRSLNAGREFWNHRRMLGRIAISNDGNPNLKDKAGREGIIDNRASRVFRSIAVNILTTSARRYFGSSSQIRKETLPELQGAYEERQKELERERLLKKNRRQFRSRLESNYPSVGKLFGQVSDLRGATRLVSQNSDDTTCIGLQQKLSSLKQQHSALRLGAAPKKLAPRLQNLHSEYRRQMQEIEESIRSAEGELNDTLERINPKSSKELARTEVESHTKHVHRRLSKWIAQIDKLLESEKVRVSSHGKSRMDLLRGQLYSIPADVECDRIKLTKALSLIAETAQNHDVENEHQMESLIAALESLSENINLTLLAGDSSEELSGLRTELERLTALAQLGITVEIIDHELASFNSTIAHGLKRFPDHVRESPPFKQVHAAYEGLSSRLSFLSPLKLSGDPDYRHLTGKDVESYLSQFFATDLEKEEFQIVATEEFRRFSVYEQPARIYPVFINLVNNARYWIHQKLKIGGIVKLSVDGNKVLVSDNGPGIDSEDVPDLFRLFFTRRQGGRGIGLYLCRSNLAAGGHRIAYVTDGEQRPLDGATFAIEFKNASFP